MADVEPIPSADWGTDQGRRNRNFQALVSLWLAVGAFVPFLLLLHFRGTALRFGTVAVSLAAVGYGVDGLVKARRVGNGRAVAWVGVSLGIAIFVMTALVVRGLVDWRF
jgi:hypothetical protein